ncbi:MAG: DUF3052 domain-containing protein [Actinomycetota bacterium]
MARDDAPSTKPLLDKLGVRPEHRISVLGRFEPAFLAELATRTDDVSTRRRARSELLFLLVESRSELRKLRTQRNFITPEGAVWAVWPKGSKDVNENDVRDAAIASGLVDVKVVSFSERLSALKLVIRLKDR